MATVAEYFAEFAGKPTVTLDESQKDARESYILIDNGLVSIGKQWREARQVISQKFVGGYVYTVHNADGEDDGQEYADLGAAVKVAMQAFALELFHRVNDRIVTAAQAEEYLAGRG